MKNDPTIYYMAAEKVTQLIYTIDGFLKFTEEFDIKSENSVRVCLEPYLVQLHNWLKVEEK